MGAAAVAVALLALAPVGAGADPGGRPGKPSPSGTTAFPPAIVSGTVTPSTITAGQLAIQTINLSARAPQGGLWISLSAPDVVYSAFVGSYVVVPEGKYSVSFPIRVSANVTEPRQVTLYANAPGQSSVPAGKVTVQPIDPAVQAIKELRFDQRVVVGGQRVTGTVELTAPARPGGQHVDLWSNSSYGGVYVQVPALAVVPEGTTTASFTVPVQLDGGPNEGNPGAYLGTSRDSTPVAAVPSTFAVGPGFVRIGTTVNHVVGIGDAPNPDGTRVSLSIDMPGVTVPASVDIPPGSPGAVFPVTGAADLSPSARATLTATWNGQTATVSVITGY
ncbi:MAG: hypothetical protein WA890_00645 [Micromonospora sp.]